MSHLIIGLSGKRSSGKDTIAKMLIDNLHFHPFSFAGPLKELCLDFFDITNKGITEKEKNEVQNHLFLNGKHPTYRDILQYIGTDIFRNVYPDVWAQKTIKNIKIFQNIRTGFTDSKTVITDVRFPNEVDVIEKAGGYVIRLTRDVFKDDYSLHASETALDGHHFNYTVDNANMTIDEQYTAVLGLLDMF